MKNHLRRDGQLLQTNKKWSHLSMKQKAWIVEMTKAEHQRYVEEHGRLPLGKYKVAVIDRVHALILERKIWLPERELVANVGKCIDRCNRTSLKQQKG